MLHRRFVRRSRIITLGIVGLLAHAAGSASALPLAAIDYQPLVPGQVATYQGFDQSTFTLTTLADTVDVNGVATRAQEQGGGDADGSIQYLTNDADGLRMHQLFAHDVLGTGITGTTTFSAPVLLLGASFSVGDSFVSSGSVELDFGVGPLPSLSYTATSTVVGVESVTVPAGTFAEALRVELSLALSGEIAGEPISVTEDETDFLAAHVGTIKQFQTADPLQSAAELVSVPEPGALALTGLGLVMLALGRQRSGSADRRSMKG